jgi:hypothetical protein
MIPPRNPIADYGPLYENEEPKKIIHEKGTVGTIIGVTSPGEDDAEIHVAWPDGSVKYYVEVDFRLEAEKAFHCPRCRQWRPWSEGCGDSDLCDTCSCLIEKLEQSRGASEMLDELDEILDEANRGQES